MAGPARADQFAYVTNMPAGAATGGSVSRYRVGAGGLLSPLTPAAVNAGHSGGGINGFHGAAVSPDGASVYVAGGLGRGVLQYDVGADGALIAKRPPSVAGTGPGAIAVNPSGASVYVTAVEYDALLQYDVGTDGALSPKTPPTALADGALAIIPASRLCRPMV